jgi:hypothetical protein
VHGKRPTWFAATKKSWQDLPKWVHAGSDLGDEDDCCRVRHRRAKGAPESSASVLSKRPRSSAARNQNSNARLVWAYGSFNGQGALWLYGNKS